MAGIPRITDDDVDRIISFIEDTVKDSGADGVIVGMSGGLDSAVVSQLCADAIGGDRVLDVFMPTDMTSDEDRRMAAELSRSMGTEFLEVSVQPAVDAFVSMLDSEDRGEIGNIAARSRMVTLFALAKRERKLVVGTSNRSESLMGYFTKYGDGACDISPILGFYKTQIREMAVLLGMPEEVISKPPSAGLWKGQTDEGDMGVTYDKLDIVLYGIENGMADDHIASASGVDMMMIGMIRDQVASTAHKRRPPATPRGQRNLY